MNTLAELQRQLFDRLGYFMKPHGFIPKPADNSFRSGASFGWASIHLTFIRHPPTDFDVVVGASIRFDAVENMTQDADSLVKPSDRKKSATIGCELGNLLGVGQKRWTVASDGDIGPVASEIVIECEATLLPFIQRYSDLGHVLETLRAGGERAGLISPLEAKRDRTIEALSKMLSS